MATKFCFGEEEATNEHATNEHEEEVKMLFAEMDMCLKEIEKEEEEEEAKKSVLKKKRLSFKPFSRKKGPLTKKPWRSSGLKFKVCSILPTRRRSNCN